MNSTLQDHSGGRQNEAPEQHLQEGQQEDHVEEARLQLRELFQLFYGQRGIFRQRVNLCINSRLEGWYISSSYNLLLIVVCCNYLLS